jgi:outer membrane receptor protein involved in Fe transport
VNGDGIDDRVQSFRNVDAWLTGLEAEIELRPTHRLSLPARASFVRGWNDTDDRDLPEIPPLEGSAAARWRFETAAPAWLELESRFAMRQPFVDRAFPEDATPAWAILSLRGGVTLGRWARLRVGVENLLDAEYHEHLTREALLPVGELAAGDEVPAPGRGFFVSLQAGL